MAKCQDSAAFCCAQDRAVLDQRLKKRAVPGGGIYRKPGSELLLRGKESRETQTASSMRK